MAIQGIVGIKQKWFLIVIFIIIGCSKSADKFTSKDQCVSCHIGARAFSFLPEILRKRLDPLSETLSKGLKAVETNTGSISDVSLLSARACEPCHKQSYQTWLKSPHSRSWIDPLFQLALNKEPMQWCINCHAPLREQQLNKFRIQLIREYSSKEKNQDGTLIGKNKFVQNGNLKKSENIIFKKLDENQLNSLRVLTDEGINCAVCHIRNGKIYAGPKKLVHQKKKEIQERSSNNKEQKSEQKFSKSNQSESCILPIERSSSLRDGSFCSGCHQFNFPSRSLSTHYSTLSMQNTVAEYGMSRAHSSGIMCSECHFFSDQQPTHDTSRGTEDSFSVKFQDVKNRETGRPYLEVIVTMKNIAHSWPTGDLFRSITLQSYDINNKLLDTAMISRTYNTEKNKLMSDTTIHNQSSDNSRLPAKSIQKNYMLYYDKKPVRCKIVYRYQGMIERSLQRNISNEVIQKKYQRILFDNICLE